MELTKFIGHAFVSSPEFFFLKIKTELLNISRFSKNNDLTKTAYGHFFISFLCKASTFRRLPPNAYVYDPDFLPHSEST